MPRTPFAAVIAFAVLAFSTPTFAQTTIFNVSYDVTRELYKEINPAFEADWKAKSGEAVTVKQSHGGSSKQALSVLNGLEADVVTMNQSPDIDVIADKGIIAKDWRDRFPFKASPYTTTTVFVVRKGNPKAIKDWDDLTKKGLQVIVPNPKTSGNGRYTYLSAWGYSLQKGGDAAAAKDFVTRLFANVPVLDGGGRGATTTFTQNQIGDVLITFESEALALAREIGEDKFDIVYPSISIEAEPPVAVVDSVVDRRGTRKQATAYLEFLFSPQGQEIIANRDFRPRDAEVAAKHASRFPALKTFTVEGLLGGWEKAQKEHFGEGGVFDQIFQK
ncbi:MAG: sulfate ABC transporter substrate-binding protein [Rhodomicrobium sp.]|uniref:sulfate ABC transporter substrate-binding protein n=1 Tax=Rhodomicrobium lacus TaxID=2498452 RepID=UPI001FE21B28|nr:sulfate ABC transporter substrate-binding protein [Rhodomicrobium lacus]